MTRYKEKGESTGMPRSLAVLVLALALVAAPLAWAAHASDPDAARDVSFDSRSGNEWWVQVRLSGTDADAVVAVDAQDTDGAWKALEKKDWGDWAASFHVEPGHEVRFVAKFDDGGHVTSCWFTHPDGEATRCDTGGPDGSDDSDEFAFEPKNGNEWWVQVDVSPEPAAVQAMDTDGAWVSLEHKSWGDWAASFHVEAGHEVRFRAHDGDGDWTTSCWYSHPEGDVTECGSTGDGGGDDGEDADGFDASFRTNGGNEWWVEAYVDANEPLSGVDARIVGEDTWHALTKRGWGAWAASFHVEAGSLVEFRATADDGRVDVSDSVYRWPSGERENRAAAWPVEGSYVQYLLESGEGIPMERSEGSRTWLWANYTYSNGDWTGTCEGWIRSTESGERHRVDQSEATAGPAFGPTDGVEPGEQLQIEVPSCSGSNVTAYVGGRNVMEGYHDKSFRQNGKPVDVPVWEASDYNDGCPCWWTDVAWHWDTGLTVDFEDSGRSSFTAGHLVDTDAPISVADTNEAPQPSWPQEGSFAEYQVTLTSEYSDEVKHVGVRFVYTSGAWEAQCDGETHAAAPPMGPTDTQEGASVRPTEVDRCDITPPPVIVQGQFPEDTTRNGEPHRATVWWADEAEWKEENGEDEDAWWDVETGLLLRWEDHGGYYSGDEGRLTNTDAPLSNG